MGANAQIVIELDEKGVVRGMQQISAEGQKMQGGLQKVGSRGNVVFTELRQKQERARDATNLLARTIGAEIPRSLEKVIARSEASQKAMAAAFNVLVVAGFATVLANLIVEGIGKLIAWWNKAEDAKNRALEAKVQEENKTIIALTQMERDLRTQAANVLANDLQQIENDYREQRLKILETAAGRELEIQLTPQKKLARIMEELDQIREGNRILLARRRADEIRDIENAATLSGLRGIEAIEEKARQDKAKLDIAFFERGLLTQEEFQRKSAALDQVTRQQIEDFARGIEKDALAARLSGQLAGAHGIRQIELQLAGELDAIRAEELDKGVLLTSKRIAAEQKAAAAIGELRRRAAEDTLRIEEDAALSLVPEFQKAYANISLDANRRLREIELAFNRTEITGGDAARRTAAVWMEASARMRNQLAGDLEHAWDAFRSGKLWDEILANFKHMVFQMIATWIVGQRSMQAATAGQAATGGGFSIGGILSKLFGIGGSRGGGFSLPSGTASGMALPGGVNTTFPSGGGGFQFGQFTPGVAGLAGLPFSAGGGAGFGGILPAGAAAGTATKLSMGARLSAMLPGLILGGGMAGVLGGQAIGFGGPGRGALAGGLMGAGLVGGGIAALWGSAVGSAGAAMGSLLLGPLGIGIIAAAALIGLLFGVFGRKKKQRQRDEIERQAFRAIEQVETSYKLHQTDYNSAIAQLEQIRQQVDQQMAQLKWPNRMHPHINAAIKRIGDIEAERQRRMQIQGGGPMFAQGGFVGAASSAPTAGFGPLGIQMPGGRWQGAGSRFGAALPRFDSGGPVPILAHAGEFVVRKQAVQRAGRANMERLNATGEMSGGGIVVNIYPQSLDRAWLRNGGAEEVGREIRRAIREGARF